MEKIHLLLTFSLLQIEYKQVVNSVKRVDDCISNVSDHYPVSLEMQVNLANKSPMKTIATNSRLNWKKIDTKQYQSTVEENLILGLTCHMKMSTN